MSKNHSETQKEFSREMRERPFQDKSERSDNKSGDNVAIHDQDVLIHSLVQSELYDYVHPRGAELQ